MDRSHQWGLRPMSRRRPLTKALKGEGPATSLTKR
ncbi:uncharacterized protein G2W53_034040 [Senna tora]|uniref:Uncharacterized protein n=1 Tax=Senna tora TaxID=362788 RepID=A0A834WDF3_9FABA|nr:uncharacterized protein G2W53_034040 [Senna tora]